MPLFGTKKDPALTGTARLSSTEQTGQVRNQQSVWRSGLTVQIPGREPLRRDTSAALRWVLSGPGRSGKLDRWHP